MTDLSPFDYHPESWFASDMVGETGVEPNSIWIGGSTVGYVAQITREGGLTDVDRRHAALIAEAPHLLVALQGLVTDWERVMGRPIPGDHEAKAAIAAATGGDL